jgi:predicted RNA-binding Zn ribbon-like protein
LVVMRKTQTAPGELERVREFLNTADLEQQTDALSDPRSLGAWLAGQGLAPEDVRVGAADLSRAVELREALRALLLAHNGLELDPDAAPMLDAAACRAKLRLRFDAAGAAHLEPEASGVAGALGQLLAIVHAAIADGSWPRLKACRDDTCQWAFYDHTKNHSGAWCTMEVCGNRAKARAYRERQTRGGPRA